MTPVGILIATTGGMASEAESWIQVCLGDVPHCRALSLPVGAGWEDGRALLGTAIERLDRGRGVLILTDVEGGTPFNLAKSFLREREVALVSGANLPMLFKSIQLARDTPLDALADAAVEYGRTHVARCRA